MAVEPKRDDKRDENKIDPAPPRAGPTEEAPSFKNAGEDETKPGQREVISGSPEHVQLLMAYPNATSYAFDVNIVPAPEPQTSDVPSTQSQPPVDDRVPEHMPDKPEGNAGLLPSRPTPTQSTATQQAEVKPDANKPADKGDKK